MSNVKQAAYQRGLAAYYSIMYYVLDAVWYIAVKHCFSDSAGAKKIMDGVRR